MKAQCALDGLILTLSPVQNMGHSCHGGSLASPNQVLRYGFRTIKGSTGGVKLDANAEPAAAATTSQRMLPNKMLSSRWKQSVDVRMSQNYSQDSDTAG